MYIYIYIHTYIYATCQIPEGPPPENLAGGRPLGRLEEAQLLL